MFTPAQWFIVYLLIMTSIVLTDTVCGWATGELGKMIKIGGWSRYWRMVAVFYLLPLVLVLHVFAPWLGDIFRPTVYIPWSAVNRNRSIK